ncbi:uncharacterized protein N7473_009240 [Penicillium subrubescens]|nr:uncharacterized protein N7473_009240 [Penicillium subrubescens]KAJ5886566.1 hypothetical protein N7473_009240 [Penicillium subrubescens]
MSETIVEDQESKTVPCCHDRPPQYDSCQPSQDIPRSVIENEHTCRILVRKIDGLNEEITNASDEVEKRLGTGNDYLLFEEFCLELGRILSEGAGTAIGLAKALRERIVENTDFYPPLSKLTESEFDRIYASRTRDSDQQMRQEDGSDHSQSSPKTKPMESDCASDSPCSCGQFFELSAKMDEINEKLSQGLLSNDAASISKTTDDAVAKPTRSFWKRNPKTPSRS